jgi:hypothetical protein
LYNAERIDPHEIDVCSSDDLNRILKGFWQIGHVDGFVAVFEVVCGEHKFHRRSSPAMA